MVIISRGLTRLAVSYWVGVGVGSAVGVGVAAGVGDGVAVAVGVGVASAVGVGVGVGVGRDASEVGNSLVGAAVGAGVAFVDAVVGWGVCVGKEGVTGFSTSLVGVGVGVGVSTGQSLGMAVGVKVGGGFGRSWGTAMSESSGVWVWTSSAPHPTVTIATAAISAMPIISLYTPTRCPPANFSTRLPTQCPSRNGNSEFRNRNYSPQVVYNTHFKPP